MYKLDWMDDDCDLDGFPIDDYYIESISRPKMKILHLNLKRNYFEDIENGVKPFEFRSKNDYWIKRLVGKKYDEVWFKLGYPSSSEENKIIKRKYLGYEEQTIVHKIFNYKPTLVFAIDTRGYKND